VEVANPHTGKEAGRTVHVLLLSGRFAGLRGAAVGAADDESCRELVAPTVAYSVAARGVKLTEVESRIEGNCDASCARGLIVAGG
jgi:hypothetical protein